MKDIEYLKSNNVNVEQGLELFGDIETYNETLIEFKNGIDDKLNHITKYYESLDMPNYAVFVHSLKSDCKYFGFTKLADMAYEHEMQSKANNVEFVKANYNALMEEASNVKRIVNGYMEDGVTNESSSSSNPINDDKNIILVADDSEVIRIFVRKIFDNDFEIAFAENGEDALNIIKKHQDDNKIKCVLLDLNMPKVDGFAVLEYIKDNNLFDIMPVTIISGDSSSDAINNAFKYPIIDMINKPFNEEKIKSIVEKTISHSK